MPDKDAPGTGPSDQTKVEAIKNPDFKVVYVDGVYGGLDPNKGNMILYFDCPEPVILKDGSMKVEKVKRNFIFEARMSPDTFIRIARWMNQHADFYEKWMSERFSKTK